MKKGAEALSGKTWNTGARMREDMPRKFLDISFTEYPFAQKRAKLLFLPSGEEIRVKGQVPCRLLGQRPDVL